MHTLRILLIEDDPDSADAMCLLLRREGSRVDWVPNGEAALDAYRTATDQPFDVIMVDLMLPDMDGASLIRQLTEIAPLPFVVIHTAASSARASEAAGSVGATAVIRKPTDWGQMRELLNGFRGVMAEGGRVRAGATGASAP